MAQVIKVLVVGAQGMLGQELVAVFGAEKKYQIFAWDKSTVDITNEQKLKCEILAVKPNIILNAAAYNAVDKCEDDPKELALAKKINGEAPGYLAKIATELDAILVHFSSDYIFNGLPEIPEPDDCTGVCEACQAHVGFAPQIGFTEQSPAEPISHYGRTKLMGEQAVRANAKKYYIIRLSKLFGKPAQSAMAKKSFFDVMLEAGKKHKEVRVVDEEVSCFTYAPDLARKTKQIVEAYEPAGTYHITNSGSCTWYEAVLELYQQAGIEAAVIPVSADEFPRPAKRPAYSVLLNTKQQPLRSWKEALREYLNQ